MRDYTENVATVAVMIVRWTKMVRSDLCAQSKSSVSMFQPQICATLERPPILTDVV